METKLIPVNITLLDKGIALKLEPSKEAIIRTAVKQLDTLAQGYKKQFPNKDDFYYLAMAILEYIATRSEMLKNIDKKEQLLADDEAVVTELLKLREMLK